MALFAPLLAFIGRQVGRIVQMAFGWGTILLFGRVPQHKQLLLAGVAPGSIEPPTQPTVVDRGKEKVASLIG